MHKYYAQENGKIYYAFVTVDNTLLQTGPLGNQTSLQIVPIESKRKKVKIILRRDRDISKDLS